MEPSRREQIFIVTIVSVLMLGGVAFGVAQFLWMGPPPPLPPPTMTAARSMSSIASVAPVPALDAAARERLLKVYHLDDNEAVRYIPKPFIPERAAAMQPVFNFRSTQVLNVVILTLTPEGQFQLNSGSTSDEFPLSSLLQIALGVDPSQIDMPPEIKAMRVSGDWIFGSKATAAQKAAGLSTALSKALGKKITVEQSQADREVVTISGTYNFKPLDDALPGSQAIELFFDARDPTTPPMRSMTISSLASMLTAYTGKTFVNEIQPQPQPQSSNIIRMVMHNSFQQARSAGSLNSGQVQKLIDLLSQQTGLEFKTTQKRMDVFKVSEE